MLERILSLHLPGRGQGRGQMSNVFDGTGTVSPLVTSGSPAGLVQNATSVNVSWVKWNLNIVIVPLSIFKQIIEVEYKETKMGYEEINMEIILQALDKTN